MPGPPDMFQYLYWPDDWAEEAVSHLRRAQAQVQILLRASDFAKVEEDIFRLTNRGVYLEVCLLEHTADRSLRYVNAKKRLVLAGAHVTVQAIHNYREVRECILVIDRRHLLSNTEYANPDDHRAILVDRSRHFQALMASGRREDPAVDDIRIRLWSSSAAVSTGEAVDIHWEVENADFIDMEPGIGAVEAAGSISMSIFEDTLFRIKAGNRRGMLMRSHLVRIAEPSELEITLSVLDRASGMYIPLEPASSTPPAYAVLKGDLIRLSWRAPVPSTLHEARLGQLLSSGNHVLEVSEDEIFVFTLRTALGESSIQASVMVLDEPSYLPVPGRVAGRQAEGGWITGWAGRIRAILRK
ncbi:MAG: hypothetical protein EBZ67_08065 [Chitinophagia bacterium]|nr:hypothetical protein [Chitinophagia bacterium]